MFRAIMVIIFINGVIVLLVVVGALILAFNNRVIPEAIWGIGGAALGSLGTLLTGHRITEFTGPTRLADVTAMWEQIAKAEKEEG
jgi:hypothetical protein